MKTAAHSQGAHRRRGCQACKAAAAQQVVQAPPAGVRQAPRAGRQRRRHGGRRGPRSRRGGRRSVNAEQGRTRPSGCACAGALHLWPRRRLGPCLAACRARAAGRRTIRGWRAGVPAFFAAGQRRAAGRLRSARVGAASLSSRRAGAARSVALGVRCGAWVSCGSPPAAGRCVWLAAAGSGVQPRGAAGLAAGVAAAEGVSAGSLAAVLARPYLACMPAQERALSRHQPQHSWAGVPAGTPEQALRASTLSWLVRRYCEPQASERQGRGRVHPASGRRQPARHCFRPSPLTRRERGQTLALREGRSAVPRHDAAAGALRRRPRGRAGAGRRRPLRQPLPARRRGVRERCGVHLARRARAHAALLLGRAVGRGRARGGAWGGLPGPHAPAVGAGGVHRMLHVGGVAGGTCTGSRASFTWRPCNARPPWAAVAHAGRACIPARLLEGGTGHTE